MTPAHDSEGFPRQGCIVIVDPIDSGAELAPAFAARGVPCIAVRSLPRAAWDQHFGKGFAEVIQPAHFLEILDPGPDLEERLRAHNPRAVIAGAESGVELADQLAARLTPEFANVPELAGARRHKGLMQAAIAKAGLPHIRTMLATSADEVSAWLVEQGLQNAALVLKPATSAGSDNVHHIPPGGDWKPVFDLIRSSRTKLRDEANDSVIVQERVFGTEFAVDFVSADGEHVLSLLNRYTRAAAGGRLTVFDNCEYLPYDAEQYGEMVGYVRQVLDALGIRWGAAHCEVMLTPDGPRMIEVGARTCGGPVLGFTRAATGSSQMDRVIEAYVDGEIRTKHYEFRQTVMPVFLIAPHAGILGNVEALEQLRTLPTHLSTHMWLGNGDHVAQTVDFESVLGIIGLAGDRDAVFADLKRIREVETQLRIEPTEHIPCATT